MWPAIVAGVGALAGGLLNSSANSVASGRAQDANADNIALQKEFAQTGVTWRTRDVMRAYGESGIHPLALLGVQGPSYTPVNYVGSSDTAMGDAISGASQNISRSMLATASEDKRMAHMKDLMSLSTESAGLDNELKRLRIQSEAMRLRQQLNPSMPVPGASEASIVNPGVEPKIIPDVTVTRTPRGGYVTLPSEAAQQRMSEMFGLSSEWFSRNRAWLATPEARQWVKSYLPKPPSNTEWRYHVPTGEWLPSYIDYGDRHLPHPARRYAPGGFDAPNFTGIEGR